MIRVSSRISRRFMRHGVQPLALSFPARRNDAGGGNFRNPKRGVPRVFRKFPTVLPCIMEPRRKTIPVKGVSGAFTGF